MRVRSISVAYDATPVLRSVDLDVADGELFFLLGPSGCGKTTLLRAIAGFIEPDDGEIFFDDRPMRGVGPAQRDCGMVFQNYALWPHLTVYENVAFGLDVRKVKQPEKRERVLAALKLVRMEAFADRPPNRLSGGQQQRVALARALVVDPQVLLLDEPLSNLDAALRVELRGEIREIQRKTRRTAVYVTHDRAEALALADRIAVLRDGRVEQVGTVEEIYERPVSPFVAGFVGEVNALPGGRITGVDGGRVRVEGPYGSLNARVPAMKSLDGEALVLLRPERLRIAVDGQGQQGLAGTLLRKTFLGEVVQYDVGVAGGAHVKVLALSGGPAPAEGSAVRVVVEDAMVYPQA